MTVAFWCVLIVILLPLVCTSIAKFGSGRFSARQNHNPRDFLDNLEGCPVVPMPRSRTASKQFRVLPQA